MEAVQGLLGSLPAKASAPAWNLAVPRGLDKVATSSEQRGGQLTLRRGFEHHFGKERTKNLSKGARSSRTDNGQQVCLMFMTSGAADSLRNALHSAVLEAWQGANFSLQHIGHQCLLRFCSFSLQQVRLVHSSRYSLQCCPVEFIIRHITNIVSNCGWLRG